MKRQNILKEEVQEFNPEKYKELLASDLSAFGQYIDTFTARKLTITKAIKDLDRQLLFSWKKNGLLPFRTKVDSDKKTWNRFSFIETCWLKVLIAFRNQGVGIERLKVIKGHLYPENFEKELFSAVNLADIQRESPFALEKLKSHGVTSNRKLKKFEVPKEVQEETQLSLFFLLILATIQKKLNVVLYVDEKGSLDIIELSSMLNDPVTGVRQAFDIFNSPSLTAVNITKIIADLSGTHEHFSKEINRELLEQSK